MKKTIFVLAIIAALAIALYKWLTNGENEETLKEYAPFKGHIDRRNYGALVAYETGEAVQYGLFNTQERGRLLITPGTKVYQGMIVGTNPKGDDIVVNVCKRKQLSNMRSCASDDALRLEPVKALTLEDLPALEQQYSEDFKNIQDTDIAPDNGNSGSFTEDVIIDVKKKYPDRVILLLGNHDCGYAIDRGICDVRRDRRNSKKIEELFETNKDMFQLADEAYISDKHFIFSHAGINKLYAKDCFGDSVNEDNVVTLFNDAFKNDNYGVMQSLGYYSRYRGRFGGDYGSLIWADAREWFYGQDDTLKTQNEPYGFSIVGHSIMSKPYITENMAFLDTQEAHCLLENGEILTYKKYIESNG